ncbi:CPBP family glutamic-type intramembrane protease [Niabella hibiscisoli]|uniref:CPBP family glutamic-type intramembrane protease n=1 Tax=Niabella hibiscisoli TaxID=1825928 RepID=UPI00374CE8A5
MKDENKNCLFIICSSLLFALMHGYNWLYRVNAFLGGVTLNYSYLYFKKAKFYPYLSVVLIHLLYNLCVFIIKKHFA